MSEREEWVRHEVQEITFFIILGIFMTVGLPYLMGYVFKGFAGAFVTGRALAFGDILVYYMIYYKNK